MNREHEDTGLLRAIARGYVSPPAVMVFAVWFGLTSLAGYRTADEPTAEHAIGLLHLYELTEADRLASLWIGGECRRDDEIAAIYDAPEPQAVFVASAAPVTYDFRSFHAPELEPQPPSDAIVAAPLPFNPIEELQNAQHAGLADGHAGLLPIEPEPDFTPEPAASAQVFAVLEPELPEQSSALGRSFRHFLALANDESADPEIRTITHQLRSGETISSVLDGAGVDRAETREWIRAAQAAYNLDRVYAGQDISLTIDSAARRLQRLSFETDRTTLLVVERDERGIAAELREIPHYTRLRVVGGEITKSLYMAAVSQGIPDAIISDVAEILGWELDFSKDLEAGALYRIVFEELVRTDTNEAMPGRVLAVDLVNRGRMHEGYYFIASDGARGGYYNRKGEALGRAFLRYPVKYSRISSHFSNARYHPVLKTNVPHYGVDFAAPTGTPIQAVADGVVDMARWHRGNGRFVKLRHDRVYESGYAHLSRIAAGIKPGVRVRKGEVIGYVGMSGLATGPHLHFAMYQNGAYIDPLTAELPRAQSLVGSTLRGFEMSLAMIDHAYAQAGLVSDAVAQLAQRPEDSQD